jgi:hypothetical protein
MILRFLELGWKAYSVYFCRLFGCTKIAATYNGRGRHLKHEEIGTIEIGTIENIVLIMLFRINKLRPN